LDGDSFVGQSRFDAYAPQIKTNDEGNSRKYFSYKSRFSDNTLK